MAMRQLVLLLLVLHTARSDHTKRLLLHSDEDISQALQELRQDNLALKAQLAHIQNGKLNYSKLSRSDDSKRLLLHSDEDISQALHELRQDTSNLALKAQLAHIQNDHGSTYVRWGRTVCGGNGTQKVYSGYAGGSYYGTEGKAASYICLPDTPSWANYKDGIQNIGGQVYGAEYEIYESTFTPFSQHMDDEDVPCAVCYTPRATNLMIPATTSCYPGWTLEYTGYLMTGSEGHKAASDYACVDADPEAVLHGEADLNGKHFYFAEVHCGSLPCQTYPQGRELACAVCSR